MMATPNLFDFATSELSQDAFLCWVIANARHEARPDLSALGRAFIAWLWVQSRGVPVTVEHVQLVDGPHRQRDHIDILFKADVAGCPTTFLIEDKTDTSHHHDQLRRYKSLHQDPVCVYFKTGYHFGEDLRAREHGYTVIGLREWVGFLNEHCVEHDVFDEYRRYAANLVQQRDDDLAALLAPQGYTKLAVDAVQWEFIMMLAARCGETVGGGAVHHGKNLDGTPWTHWRFARFAAALGGSGDEVLFHRIDARRDEHGIRRYYLSTRQYAKVKGNLEAQRAKLGRLQTYRAAFARAVSSEGSGLKFSRPAGDRHGANESEIGILFFDDEANTVASVLEKFPAVHHAIVRFLARQ